MLPVEFITSRVFKLNWVFCLEKKKLSRIENRDENKRDSASSAKCYVPQARSELIVVHGN